MCSVQKEETQNVGLNFGTFGERRRRYDQYLLSPSAAHEYYVLGSEPPPDPPLSGVGLRQNSGKAQADYAPA